MPNIPNAQPYSGPNNYVPSIIGREPKEGRKSIPYVINWSRPIAAGLDTVLFNPQGNSPLEFSQIAGLIVDNSQCGASLDFIFPDTDVTISIPAYAPYTVLQVNSRAIQFYVRALGPLGSDVTSFAILNWSPMPVAVPPTNEQLVSQVAAISSTSGSSFQILPLGTTGTVEDFQAAFRILNSANSDSVSFRLTSLGMVIYERTVSVAAGQTVNITLAEFSSVAIRFPNGLEISALAAGPGLPGGFFSTTLLYRTP